MGLIQPGVLGMISQSAGNITFADWKDKHVFKTKIVTIESYTPKQLFARARFTFVQNFVNVFYDLICLRFWWKWATGGTTYTNAFSTHNIKAQPAYSEEVPVFVGDLTKVKMAIGTVEQPVVTGAPTYNTETGELSVGWSAECTGNGLATDKVFFLACVLDKGTDYIHSTKTRADESLTLELPIGLTVDSNICCFLFVFRGVEPREITGVSEQFFAVGA